MEQMLSSDPIVIVSARRTPIGSFQGKLSGLSASSLGASAISACLQDLELQGLDLQKHDLFAEALLGCVLSAGQGQAPARQAVLSAGLPTSVGATTINKMCGSGLYAVILACNGLRAQNLDAIIAGGMESMSGAPYLLPKARGGLRMGHGEVIDHMLRDGLEDSCEVLQESLQGKREVRGARAGKSMGFFAEETAREAGITRKEMDDFSIRSVEEARRANEDGSFSKELVPISLSTRSGETFCVEQDEQPFKSQLDKIPKMKGAFVANGNVTAANSSSISDGAAALVLTRRSFAEQQGWSSLARVVAGSCHAREPQRFTLAPIEALRKLSAACGWRLEDVDLFEINEAFAVVPLATMGELKIPLCKVNVNGGACALGHPIGASGARILVTLLSALHARSLRRGMAAICIGGGEALALAIEVERG